MSVTGMPVERPQGPPPRVVHESPGDPPRILYEGLVSAAIGYVVLAGLIALWSLSRGHPAFYDAALLGADLFFDATVDPARIDPAHVLAYNGAHLLVFVLFGFGMAWLASVAERIPNGWYLIGIGFLFVVVHMAAFPLWFGEAVTTELPLSVLAVATTAAFVAMAGWLLREHPALRAAAHEPEGDGE